MTMRIPLGTHQHFDTNIIMELEFSSLLYSTCIDWTSYNRQKFLDIIITCTRFIINSLSCFLFCTSLLDGRHYDYGKKDMSEVKVRVGKTINECRTHSCPHSCFSFFISNQFLKSSSHHEDHLCIRNPLFSPISFICHLRFGASWPSWALRTS